MKVTLYHGTSSERWGMIQEKGLDSPYLTSSVDLAKYYAEVSSEEDGSEPVVLIVVICVKSLRYDGNAMDEPVGFDGYSISDLDQKVLEKYEELSQIHPEWIHNNFLVIPSTEYQISLEVVGSCRSDHHVFPSEIKVV